MRLGRGGIAEARAKPGRCSRSPRIRATASGARSNIATSAGGSCAADSMRTPVSILPPSSPSSDSQRVGDRLRPACRDRPAVPMACGDDAKPDRRGHRVVQRAKGMRRNTAEQRPRPLGAEEPGERRGRKNGRHAEPGQRQRMSGHPEQRAHDVLGKRVEPRRRRAERRAPPGPVGAEPGGGVVDRALQHARIAAVERVHTVDLGPAPAQPVAVEAEAVQERRTRPPSGGSPSSGHGAGPA